MEHKPIDFREGDIITPIKTTNPLRYMVIKMEMDITILDTMCTIREIGTDYVLHVDYSTLRYSSKKLETTKLGRLLYGRDS